MIPASPSTMAATTSVTIPDYGVGSFDPSQWGNQVIFDQGTLLEGLVGYSPAGKIVPKVANNWTVSDGGKVWTFYLRHNARWSNGQPVTAEDFYYAWMRTLSPANTTSAWWAGVMLYVLNGVAYHEGEATAQQVGLKVVNPYEIRITLDAPVDILTYLTLAASMPLYPPVVEEYPTTWYLPQHWVGNGPYVLKSFVIDGALTLAKNPDYVGHPGETNVGNVSVIHTTPTPSVVVEDYDANKLDAGIIASMSDFHYVETHPALKSQLHSVPADVINYLEWDKSPDPSPLDNQLVRQAVAMAINRQPIVSALNAGMSAVTTQFAFPGWPTYGTQHALAYNVKAARALLAKAGYPNGRGFPTLMLYCEAGNPLMAEAVQAELKQNLNINFKIDPLPATSEYNPLTYDGVLPNIQPGYVTAIGTTNFNVTVDWGLMVDVVNNNPGGIGSDAYRQHISAWYFNAYDPRDVKEFGNPTDASMGVRFSQWAPLEKAAMSDMKYLNAWYSRQPAAYQAVLRPPGSVSMMQSWDLDVAAWQHAKTAAAKHAAWLNAWDFVGNYSTGTGEVHVGLNGQVYEDEHEPAGVHYRDMLFAELGNTASTKTIVNDWAIIANQLMDEGYAIPIDYSRVWYLEKPNLTGVVANPAAFAGLYELQYLNLK